MRCSLTILFCLWFVGCSLLYDSRTINHTRETKYLHGSSQFNFSIKNITDSILFDSFYYENYFIEKYVKREAKFQVLAFDTLFFEQSISFSLDSLFLSRVNKTLEIDDRIVENNKVNQVSPDQTWDQHLSLVLNVNHFNNSAKPKITVCGRTIVYTSPDLSSGMGVIFPSGDMQYFVETDWTIMIFLGREEIYQGNAMFKDYIIQPEEQPFEYNLSKENIEKLTALALEDYFNYIKTNEK